MNDGQRGWLITERLFDVAARDPERTLLIDPVFGDTSYADAADQVRCLAQGLLEHGISSGDVVIIQLPNWSPFVIMHLALSAIGAVTGNIPFVYREHEVGRILELTGAKGIVVPGHYRGFDYTHMARNLAGDHADLQCVIVVDDAFAESDSSLLPYRALLGSPLDPTTLAALKPSLDDITALGFTSGTTGELKGAQFDSHVLAAVNRGFIDRYDLNENDRIFGCSPLGHAVGFTHAFRMALSIGGSMVMLERWDVDEAMPLMHRTKCTYMAAATPFLMDLVYHPDLARFDNLPSLKLFLCGGASVPEQLMRDAQTNLPNTFTTPLWGMTECGGVTTCPVDAPGEKLFETDGIACGEMELKVVGPDGEEVARNTDGELFARGPMVARGYVGQPELSAQYFLADGFFRTGDQARMDADGYIKITGRIKDLIIRGGVNISPVEIENVLFSHPKITTAAVVGMPDERLGERTCAFVVTNDNVPLSLAEVQAWMSQAGVAKPKWPERVEQVPALPMTPSGKIQKFRLREQLAEVINNDAAVP